MQAILEMQQPTIGRSQADIWAALPPLTTLGSSIHWSNSRYLPSSGFIVRSALARVRAVVPEGERNILALAAWSRDHGRLTRRARSKPARHADFRLFGNLAAAAVA